MAGIDFSFFLSFCLSELAEPTQVPPWKTHSMMCFGKYKLGVVTPEGFEMYFKRKMCAVTMTHFTLITFFIFCIL